MFFFYIKKNFFTSQKETKRLILRNAGPLEYFRAFKHTDACKILVHGLGQRNEEESKPGFLNVQDTKKHELNARKKWTLKGPYFAKKKKLVMVG